MYSVGRRTEAGHGIRIRIRIRRGREIYLSLGEVGRLHGHDIIQHSSELSSLDTVATVPSVTIFYTYLLPPPTLNAIHTGTMISRLTPSRLARCAETPRNGAIPTIGPPEREGGGGKGGQA